MRAPEARRLHALRGDVSGPLPPRALALHHLKRGERGVAPRERRRPQQRLRASRAPPLHPPPQAPATVSAPFAAPRFARRRLQLTSQPPPSTQAPAAAGIPSVASTSRAPAITCVPSFTALSTSSCGLLLRRPSSAHRRSRLPLRRCLSMTERDGGPPPGTRHWRKEREEGTS